MVDLKPAVVRSPGVKSGMARVVSEGGEAWVVTSKGTSYLELGAPLVVSGANKFSAPLADGSGELVVVKAGGCLCGKPWLKAGTAQSYLDGEHEATGEPAVVATP